MKVPDELLPQWGDVSSGVVVAKRCRGKLWYKQFCGMRVYTDRAGKPVFLYWCPECGREGTNDGRATICLKPEKRRIMAEDNCGRLVRYKDIEDLRKERGGE